MSNDATTPMASLQINGDMVKDMVKTAVSAAIVKSLDGSDRMVQELVRQILDRKVDSKGHRDDGYYGKPLIEWLVGEALQRTAKEVLDEFLAERREQIKAAIRAELNTPKRAKSIAKAYVDAAEKSVNSKWSFSCDVRLQNPE